MNRHEIKNRIAFKIWTAVPPVEKYKIGAAAVQNETLSFFATIHLREFLQIFDDSFTRGQPLAYSFICFSKKYFNCFFYYIFLFCTNVFQSALSPSLEILISHWEYPFGRGRVFKGLYDHKKEGGEKKGEWKPNQAPLLFDPNSTTGKGNAALYSVLYMWKIKAPIWWTAQVRSNFNIPGLIYGQNLKKDITYNSISKIYPLNRCICFCTVLIYIIPWSLSTYR